jgi:LPXTG-site transpeptidase (sortase) family protein
MKAYASQVLIITIFLIFPVVMLLYLDHVGVSNAASFSKADVQTLASETQTVGVPVRLEIPTIGVDAAIEYVGVDSKGIMDVPVNSNDVGWFYPGPRPGEIGSAVIDGHLDNKDGSDAVFANLNKLKQGDHLYIVDGNGIPTIFIVQGSHEYNVGYADDIFSRNDGTYLNLITCDGVWDGAKKSYNKRLVVTAEIGQ